MPAAWGIFVDANFKLQARAKYRARPQRDPGRLTGPEGGATLAPMFAFLRSFRLLTTGLFTGPMGRSPAAGAR
jgi:hypothetical protein